MTQTVKIVVDEVLKIKLLAHLHVNVQDEEDAAPKLTQREIEDMERAEKEAQQRKDDIATVIAMTIILIASVLVVIFKVHMNYPFISLK